MKRFITYVLVLLAVLPAVAARRDIGPSAADVRKASYIFLEAQNQKQQGNADAFFDLTRYAHQLDPTNEAVAYYLGYATMSMGDVSREEFGHGLALMRPYVDHHPDSYYETMVYGDACMALGQVQESMRVIKAYADSHPGNPEVLVRLADGYARNKDYKSAVAVYDSIEATQGKSIVVTTRKVSALQMMQDTAAAIAEVRSLLATAPRNTSYNIALASIFQQYGQNDSALIYLDRAQQLEPDNGNTYLAKAQFYNLIGDSVNYDKQTYQALISKDLDVESKIDVLTDYIRHLLQAGDSSQRVEKLFDVLIEQHPHEPSIRSLYTDYLLARDNYAGAAEQLGYELDLTPTDADSWKKLMFIRMMAKDYPAAIQAANKALELNPDNMDLYQYIGPSYYEMKEYKLAIDTYDHALAKCDSTNQELRSDLLAGKGDVLAAQGDTTAAVAAYEQAIAIYATNSGALNNYAYLLTISGRDLDKAERMAAKAVQAQPDNVSFLDTYAWVFFKKKDYVMAQFYIESAVKNSGSDVSKEVLSHYGDILWMQGKHDEAMKQWQEALKQAPDDALLKRKVEEKKYFEK